jgi:hypothetical protein
MRSFNTFFKTLLPKNILLSKPILGSLVITLFSFAFVVIYKPLDTHSSLNLNYQATMALYCLVSGLFAFLALYLLNRISFFSGKKPWNLKKEFIAILIVLLAFSIGAYFLGFYMEPPSGRWTLSTFLGTLRYGFLIGGLPLLLVSVMNLRYVILPERVVEKTYRESDPDASGNELIEIDTGQKKTTLQVNPNHLLYLESRGNYLDVYWVENDQLRDMTIRSSVRKAMLQFNTYDFLFQTHRAFIVNLKMVVSKHGNSLGYQLKLPKVKSEVPVSRQKVRAFDERMADLTVL